MEQRTLISNAADIFRNKYICFEGRAGRKEFWYFFLFNFIISLILGIVDAIIGVRILGGLYSLAVLLPCLSVGARRLHDRNLSGWLQLLYLLPDAGEDGHTALINFKERIYKELCLSHGLTLSPGSEKILGFLKENGKRMAIASSAPKMNMEWYIPEYGLERFFERRNIIAGRSDIPSKPDPAIFRLAMEMIKTEPERTVIFEDSASGVKAALASGAFLVVRINDGSAEGADDERVRSVRSFSELTLSI